MLKIKKLNETAVGIFTDSEEDADEVVKKLTDIFGGEE